MSKRFDNTDVGPIRPKPQPDKMFLFSNSLCSFRLAYSYISLFSCHGHFGWAKSCYYYYRPTSLWIDLILLIVGKEVQKVKERSETKKFLFLSLQSRPPSAFQVCFIIIWPFYIFITMTIMTMTIIVNYSNNAIGATTSTILRYY